MICEDREMNDDWSDIMSQSLFEKEIKSSDDLEEDIYRMKNVDIDGQFESITLGTSNKRLGVSSASNGCSKTSTATRDLDMKVCDKYGPHSSIGNEFASDAALTPLDTTEDSLNSSGSATLKAESESLLSQTSSPVKLMEASFRSEEFMNGTTSKALPINNGLKMSKTILPGKSQPDAVESKKKLKYGTMRGKEEFSKSDSLAKTCHSSPSIRKGKLKSNIVNDKGTPDGDKLNAVRHKSKKSPGLALNSHVEAGMAICLMLPFCYFIISLGSMLDLTATSFQMTAVEGKLNELLDTEGGISKRKVSSPSCHKRFMFFNSSCLMHLHPFVSGL